MLKIAAVSCQWLNVDPIDRGEKIVFSEQGRENIGFHGKLRGNLCFLGESQGNVCQNVLQSSLVCPIAGTKCHTSNFCRHFSSKYASGHLFHSTVSAGAFFHTVFLHV